ncbi:protein-disulfide reductase DsbD [Piscinibacter sp. HJYY11]|uniref:protein-disulfide reductase DsbD n=1 Tax=Piscinibacter sp. HJYY11 TaxID=2801333 RepID=UPI00191E0CD7|nr:protein-disulfide reductase DsbD [Piscinibacter sp. HJYY11]MBL0726935.1 protein-disulfide reductase DsbD [Piscinibacter sp. HJYY11]
MSTWAHFKGALRLATGALASLLLAAGALAADEFLDPEVAFRPSARALDANHIEVRFDIAPGYYLYRERLGATAEPAGIQVTELRIPAGKIKYDETFQKDVETYRDSVTMTVALAHMPATPFKLTITNQGCADKGLCYSPQKRGFKVEPGQGAGGAPRFTYLNEAQAAAYVPGGAATGAVAAALTGGPSTASPTTTPAQSSAANLPEVAAPAATTGEPTEPVGRALQSGSTLLVVGLFFLLGLGLSFTPCVLPMLPILSSIIVGQGQPVSKARGFSLALAYSLGMALVYTLFGVVSALAGEGLGQALQNVWVLGGFALLLAVLSLSMFGFYELQMPVSVQNRLNQFSQRFTGGQFASVFVMGGLSALIVGPCVAAPLAGALVYISQTRDVVLGGTALFSMAGGMSVPLLLLGLSAGALLPKAGEWMKYVKLVFGVMLLAVAVWMVAPVLPSWAGMLLTAGVLVVAAACLGAFSALPKPASVLRRFSKGAGVLLGVFAVAQVVGAATGGRELARPLAHLGKGAPAHAELAFQTVRSVAELDAAVRASTKPVMLDFYADWCVACKELEKFTFTDPAVAKKMAGMTLLRADVTANNDDDRALLKRYTLFGPPALIFFAPAGNELPASRVIGYQDARQFGSHLDRVLATAKPLSGPQVGLK